MALSYPGSQELWTELENARREKREAVHGMKARGKRCMACRHLVLLLVRKLCVLPLGLLMWYVVCGMWYVVCGMWYVVCGMWYVYEVYHMAAHVVCHAFWPRENDHLALPLLCNS